MPDPRSSSRIHSADVVEEVAVVGDRDDGALVFLEEPLEPRHRLGVEMVGRLVEQQQIRRLEQQAAQRHAAPLAAGQRGDVGVRRRAAQRVHRQLELRVDVPGVDRVDAVLQPALLFEHLVHHVRRQVLAELHVQLVVAFEQRLDGRHPFLDVAEHGLGGSSRGSWCRKPTVMPSAGNASPMNAVSSPAMISEQRALAGRRSGRARRSWRREETRARCP